MEKESLRLNLTEEGWGPNLAGPPYDTEGLSMVVLGNKGAGKSNTLAVMMARRKPSSQCESRACVGATFKKDSTVPRVP